MKFLSELSAETIICSELQVRDYKNLLKSIYGEKVDSLIFIETLCDILSKISGKSSDFFKELNVIDLFCLIIDMRVNSQGNVCNVIVTKNSKKMTLELKLDEIKKDIKSLAVDLRTTITHNNLQIIFECPSVKRLMQPVTNESLSFIKRVTATHNNQEKSFDVSTNSQAEQVFERISPKISFQIIEKFNNFIETLLGANFLSRYGITEQTLTFIPSLDSLIWFTKLMFGEPLETLYENIFYLAHTGHMGSDYIENCVVGEYNYYVSCLQKTIAIKNSKESVSAEEEQENELFTGLP